MSYDPMSSGVDVTGYLSFDGRYAVISTWEGETVHVYPYFVAQTYRDHYCNKSHAIVLIMNEEDADENSGEYIVGYALDDGGSLFRGEHFHGTQDDARWTAISVSGGWIEKDQEAEEEFDEEVCGDQDDEEE